MSQTPPSWTGLSLTEKRMLLAELLREKAKKGATFALSHGQRGLWFLSQLDRASAAYNISFPARIRAPLDVAAFRRALQRLIDRHPSMRTTFEQHDGEPQQRVHEQMTLSLEVQDASSWSEEVLHRRVEEAAYRPFDLEKGPLIRMYLFSCAPDDHVFLITAHHIIGDFWSLVLLMEEMEAFYPAECAHAGEPSASDAATLRPPASHYRDFVRWQADLLAGAEGERLRSYWEKQLAGVPPVLNLPADRPRPPRFTQRGSAVSCRIEPELTAQLRALAAAEGVTLYTVLLAAFQVLLGRHSSQDDFVIGSPFAGRSRSDFERVVGYFINMVPLRADLSGDPRFRDLLQRTGATVLEALQHQDYPFPLLVERLNVKRDPSRAPLVQASFTLEKAHRPVGMGCWSFFLPQSAVRINVGGMHGEPYRLEHRTCQMDLEMILEEDEGTIYGMLRYNTDVYDEATIARLAEQYRVLLEGAVHHPERRVSELPLLTPEEERRLLYDWNDTHADYSREVCLHQLFEQQAARTPAAIAVRFGEQTLTYAELDAWANRLADVLRRRGIGPDTFVALCLERSPEMIAAILGVLKAGGAYVPLDPATPIERLRSILDDTQASILLTQHRLKGRLETLETQILCVDEPLADEAPMISAGRSPRASDLAYVIYTSGSTGRPKGVMIEHRAICNTIFWHQHKLGLSSNDRLLLLVPYVFDASIAIIFPALASGSEVVLGAPGEERDPAQILDHIRRDRVTLLPVPPSLLRLLLDERLREAGRSLRYVYCGGETMPPDLPARLFELVDVQLYNLYGPTEVSIDATWWDCTRGDDRPAVPIGRPIANVQVYVLDSHRKPVPVGVPGELYIGGAGLARGYLNDAELTAERFVPDPFRDAPDARLYRSGDRCRWLADGCLEFFGRLDHQVKLRGYRIEIGEIETFLTTHPAVHESAVIVHGEDGANPRLVAYVTARAGMGLPTAELLRRYLRERLPEYMVPSTFVLLPSMPHTPSGKVDRKALPAPLAERSASHPFIAPRTPLEEYLAGLWRELLNVQTIGVRDNFFELGGSSIQAAVLINRLQEKLGEQVYTVALFDSPTILGLVDHLAESCPDTIRIQFGAESLPADKRADNTPTAPATGAVEPSLALRAGNLLAPLQPKGELPGCFMVHPPGGIVVCYQALAYRLGEERPFYGIRSRGFHGETELPASLEEMAAEYLAVIRSVQPQGPYHLGGWSMGGVVAYEMAQQLQAQGQTVGLLALLDTTIPWNQANAPYAEDGEQSAREYGLDLTLEELDRLGPEEQLPYLWQHVQKLGLVDTDTPVPLVQQILDDLKRLFHAHIKLGNEYTIRPYAGRLTLFRPSESPVPVQTARDRNWGKLANEVEVHFVPGQHHTMVKEPHVQVLAQQLQLCLRQADAV